MVGKSGRLIVKWMNLGAGDPRSINERALELGTGGRYGIRCQRGQKGPRLGTNYPETSKPPSPGGNQQARGRKSYGGENPGCRSWTGFIERAEDPQPLTTIPINQSFVSGMKKSPMGRLMITRTMRGSFD
jgi:hypothetical protein